MNCTNEIFYLFDTYLKFRIFLEFSFFIAAVISLTCFIVGFLVSSQEHEGIETKLYKVTFYSSWYILGALVLIIFLPSKAMIEHVLNCGC